ncbi:MAG TPA: sporulation protein YunB [Firmicutes bacterium]|nr:sporulation protein YunB [Candidatus Fermentithermobacillaceae bacterium]
MFRSSGFRLASGARAGRRAKVAGILLAVLITFLWLFFLAERSIVPTIMAIAESETIRIANEVMMDTINEHLHTLLNGKVLLEFETGPTGDLLYVRTNSTALNQIQADALRVLQKAIDSIQDFTIYVPLGQALGSKLLASLGPRIPIRLIPYGSVRAQIYDSYDVTGINQTRYNILLRATCSVQVIIPLIAAETEVVTDIPLTTVLIPGKVPDTYLAIPPAK